MSLPELIEIVPPVGPRRAEITVPGSKSITNRALILAALAEGETTLRGALWSEDTQVMVECLQELGFMVNVAPDPQEDSNRHITVYGKGGTVPAGGTEGQPLELFVGNAGTAARFLSVFVCLGRGFYRLHGVARMHDRPQAALFQALRKLRYEVRSDHDRLPAIIQGSGPRNGQCAVNIDESSQFASALLLCSAVGGWEVEILGENDEESPYVVMTNKLMAAFPRSGGVFGIEPDASSGGYFWAAGWLLASAQATKSLREYPVQVSHWPSPDLQVDARFPGFLSCGPCGVPRRLSRKTDLGDSIMTAIVLAPFAEQPTTFVDLGRLRLQECERVTALRTELTRCGAKVIEHGDTLVVNPSSLHGAEIETYQDHRMAMCFAVLGLKVPGIKIRNPACVKKTFPNFFQKIGAPTPNGLGAAIRHGATGKTLGPEELFAD